MFHFWIFDGGITVFIRTLVINFCVFFFRELLLCNNILRSLPYEIGKLFHLQILGLQGNPLNKEYLKIYNEPNGTHKLLAFLLDSLPGKSFFLSILCLDGISSIFRWNYTCCVYACFFFLLGIWENFSGFSTRSTVRLYSQLFWDFQCWVENNPAGTWNFIEVFSVDFVTEFVEYF